MICRTSTLNNSAILDRLQCLELLYQPLELPCRALVCTTYMVRWFEAFSCSNGKCPCCFMGAPLLPSPLKPAPPIVMVLLQDIHVECSSCKKNIRISDHNIHDCNAKPTKDEVKMASRWTGGRVYLCLIKHQRTYQCIHKNVDRLLSIVKKTQPIHCTPDCGLNSNAKQTSKIVIDNQYHCTPFRTIRTVLANMAAQTTVYFTRVYHREKKVWLQFHTICCKYLLSPFVVCFHLGSRICLRGLESTLKSTRSLRNCRL